MKKNNNGGEKTVASPKPEPETSLTPEQRERIVNMMPNRLRLATDDDGEIVIKCRMRGTVITDAAARLLMQPVVEQRHLVTATP